MGSPEAFILLELGPGRGTLMQDALRATAKIKGFHAALRLHLLESNVTLRAQQQDKLANYTPVYIETLDDLSPQPIIVIANEFFDALPIRQFVKTAEGWCENLVGLTEGRLALTRSPPQPGLLMLIPEAQREAADGTIHEISLPSLSLLRQIAKHIARHGGGALIIDYGAAEQTGRSSLQAVSKHSAVDSFERPGEVDLTAHVDFGALRMVGAAQGLTAFGPTGQGDFLQAMGIDLRAAQLKHRADAAQAVAIDTALARLTDAAQMGQLFKALALVAPDLQPAGFP